MSYPVFTVSRGNVEAGAKVHQFHLLSGDKIPALLVGEKGSGRELGVLPVDREPQAPCPSWGQNMITSSLECHLCGEPLGPSEVGNAYRYHPENGHVPGRVFAAEVGQTRAGKPKLFVKLKATDNSEAIVVFDTPIGYRGSNSHTGDIVGWYCRAPGCEGKGTGIRPEVCPKCDRRETAYQYLPFPGKVLVRGTIAQGAAGRMGSGEQLIAIVPQGVVFRTGYSGRLYGGPAAHYYFFDGKQIIAATLQDRQVADLF